MAARPEFANGQVKKPLMTPLKVQKRDRHVTGPLYHDVFGNSVNDDPFVIPFWPAHPAPYTETEFEIAKCDEGSLKAELCYLNPK